MKNYVELGLQAAKKTETVTLEAETGRIFCLIVMIQCHLADIKR